MPEIQDIPGERLPLNFFPPFRCSAHFWICVTYLTYLLHVAYSKRGSILPLLSWFGGASANAGEPFGMVICARLGLTSARNCIVCIQLTMPCCTHSWLPHPSMYDLLLVFITLLWDQLCPGTAQWIQTSCGEFCYEAHVCDKQLLCLVVQNESNGKRPQRSERIKRVKQNDTKAESK